MVSIRAIAAIGLVSICLSTELPFKPCLHHRGNPQTGENQGRLGNTVGCINGEGVRLNSQAVHSYALLLSARICNSNDAFV